MRKILIIPVSLFLLNSCIAIHTGTISSSSIGKTVIYEDIAFGVSQTERILGFGGAGQDAMVLEAKRELIKNRPLNANEEYLNFTIDCKNTYWPFYRQTKVTMSADVVKFTDNPINEPFSDIYKNKLMGKSIANALFQIGDSIVFEDMNEGTILSLVNSDKVRILYKSKSDKLRSKKFSVDKIYTRKKMHNGCKSGDNYVQKNVVKGVEQPSVVKIEAVGVDDLLVKGRNNKIVVISYNK